MEPNKFEKHIRKELQEREIQPSPSAWERISDQLEPVRKEKRSGLLWYAVAASIIGLLIFSVVYFNSEDLINSTDVKIVDTNEETNETKTDPVIIEDEIIEQDIVVENNNIEEPSFQETQTVIDSQTINLKNQITSINAANKTIQSPIEKVVKANDFKEEVINTKILEVIAAVDSLEQNNDVLTEAEVDDLLRNAQEEILREKLFNQNGSIDAMALLNEVEDELDKSFRDQIFESLKTGFLKVRTAVADRNK